MKSKTFNNGSLGSGNDEERSETRKVMRIAESVSHRIFERTLRLSVFREARLFERHYKLQAWLDVGRCLFARAGDTPGTRWRRRRTTSVARRESIASIWFPTEVRLVTALSSVVEKLLKFGLGSGGDTR